MKKKNKIHIVVDSLFSEKQIEKIEDELCYLLYNRFRLIADIRISRNVMLERGTIEIRNMLQTYSEKQTIMPDFKVLLDKKESIISAEFTTVISYLSSSTTNTIICDMKLD